MIQHTLNTPYPVGPVHFYTAEIEDGFMMFDTGPYTMEAVGYFTNKLDLSKLRKVFVTHCHADHCGMLDFICKNSDAQVYMSKYDAMLYEELDLRLEVLAKLFLDMGFPNEIMEAMEKNIAKLRAVNPKPDDYKILEESGDDLKELGLDYIRCPGHSQSDVVYLYKHYAVSGDVILRNIFTTPLLDMNFDTREGRFSNYEAYCSTLKKIKSIEDRTFMPGHRETIDSVDERIIFYAGKLFDRALKLRPLLDRHNIYEVAQTLIPDTMANPLNTYLKSSEILFIRDLIQGADRLKAALAEIGLAEKFEAQFAELALPL